MVVRAEPVVDRIIKGPGVAAAACLYYPSGVEGCITCQVVGGLIASVGIGKHTVAKTASEDQILDRLDFQVGVAVDVVVLCLVHASVECHLGQRVVET